MVIANGILLKNVMLDQIMVFPGPVVLLIVGHCLDALVQFHIWMTNTHIYHVLAIVDLDRFIIFYLSPYFFIFIFLIINSIYHL